MCVGLRYMALDLDDSFSSERRGLPLFVGGVSLPGRLSGLLIGSDDSQPHIQSCDLLTYKEKKKKRKKVRL